VASGLVLMIFSIASMAFFNPTHDMTTGYVLGFLSMFIALSVIFVATKQYRDKELGGSITFLRATSLGLLIGLIATVFYVGGWEVYFNNSVPDFYTKYAEMEAANLAKSGLDSASIAAERAEGMEFAKELESNMPYRMLFTSLEFYPVVILFSLISGAIFRKKQPTQSSNT